MATNLRSGRPWVEERLIFYTVHGSHAYGTNIATSDKDFRGITIPPPEIFHGFTGKFAQAESKKFRQNKKPEKLGNAPAEDILTLDSEDDVVIFDIRKFFALAVVNNPNALEIIFTDPSDHIKVTPAGQLLLDNRELFLSKKARNTFGGYARSQMRRILSHFKYLQSPPQAPPTRAEFNLPERTVIPADQLAAAFSAIQKVMDRWEWKDLDDLDPDLRIELQNKFQDRLLELTQWSWQDQRDKIWDSAARSIGLDTNFIELLDMERRYNAKQKEWESYQRWVKNRNPLRAELEAKYGFDGKHAMHLCRLYTTCMELLTTGKLHVRRPKDDIEWLLSIRNGDMTFPQLLEWVDKQEKLLEAAYHACTVLPKDPDINKLNNLCIQLVEASFLD